MAVRKLGRLGIIGHCFLTHQNNLALLLKAHRLNQGANGACYTVRQYFAKSLVRVHNAIARLEPLLMSIPNVNQGESSPEDKWYQVPRHNSDRLSHFGAWLGHFATTISNLLAKSSVLVYGAL